MLMSMCSAATSGGSATPSGTRSGWPRASAQREILAQRVALGIRLPHEDAAQVGVAAEGDAEHVVHLTFEPVGAAPQRHDRVDSELALGIEFHFDAQVGPACQGAQVVDH